MLSLQDQISYWIRRQPAWYSAHLVRKAIEARSAAGLALLRSAGGPDHSARPSGGGAAFIVGSGRSGTSILGEMCAGHPSVSYAFEPNGRWAAVCSATDVWGTYSLNAGRAAMDATDVTRRLRRRYGVLFPGLPGQIFVDKSPAHTLRLGFLAELAPEARFIHIHRNGLEVAASALRWISERHELVFGHVYNSWWGVDDAKWLALLAVGDSQDRATVEAGLVSDLQKAAYEWILSLEAVARDRHLIEDRILDVNYSQLVDEPDVVLRSVQRFLGLSDDEAWFRAALSLVNQAAPRSVAFLQLPAPLADRFNDIQARYEYPGRAEAT